MCSTTSPAIGRLLLGGHHAMMDWLRRTNKLRREAIASIRRPFTYRAVGRRGSWAGSSASRQTQSPASPLAAPASRAGPPELQICWLLGLVRLAQLGEGRHCVLWIKSRSPLLPQQLTAAGDAQPGGRQPASAAAAHAEHRRQETDGCTTLIHCSTPCWASCGAVRAGRPDGLPGPITGADTPLDRVPPVLRRVRRAARG